MARETSSKKNASETQPKYDGFDDIREKEGSGQYPNYWVRKTRSGHTMIFDDSKDKESITIQHRSGAMIQFMPDGAVQYVSHNGQQNIVFGENSVLVTGAQDTTVRGDSSTVAHGNSTDTCHGNKETSVGKAYNVVADSHNAKYSKQCDISANSMTVNATGPLALAAGDSCTVSGKGGMLLASTDSGCGIFGKTGAVMSGESSCHVESKTEVNVKSKAFYADADVIHFNSGKASAATDKVKMPPPPGGGNGNLVS